MALINSPSILFASLAGQKELLEASKRQQFVAQEGKVVTKLQKEFADALQKIAIGDKSAETTAKSLIKKHGHVDKTLKPALESVLKITATGTSTEKNTALKDLRDKSSKEFNFIQKATIKALDDKIKESKELISKVEAAVAELNSKTTRAEIESAYLKVDSALEKAIGGGVAIEDLDPKLTPLTFWKNYETGYKKDIEDMVNKLDLTNLITEQKNKQTALDSATKKLSTAETAKRVAETDKNTAFTAVSTLATAINEAYNAAKTLTNDLATAITSAKTAKEPIAYLVAAINYPANLATAQTALKEFTQDTGKQTTGAINKDLVKLEQDGNKIKITITITGTLSNTVYIGTSATEAQLDAVAKAIDAQNKLTVKTTEETTAQTEKTNAENKLTAAQSVLKTTALEAKALFESVKILDKMKEADPSTAPSANFSTLFSQIKSFYNNTVIPLKTKINEALTAASETPIS